MRLLQLVASIVVITASAGIANAGGGTAFTYQGRLLDAGEPASGLFDLEFWLWDAASGGTLIGSPLVLENTPVTDGLFTVQVDLGADVFDNADRWLEIFVDATRLSPRQPIARTPYAIQTRGIFVDEAGNVGIGTTDPEFPLRVITAAHAIAIRVRNTSSTGGRHGVWSRTDSPNGFGVIGLSLAGSGTGTGVTGQTNAPSGFGVFSFGDFGGTGAKYFIQPHPSDPSKEIRFVSLEGNESGTYFRGSTSLVSGRAYIDVPEEFRLVSELDGLTVQVTARGPALLWVESADLDRIVVVGNGDDVNFDYFVNGIRRGYANLELIRENRAYVPEVRDVPFATQYTEAHRQILVENGTLNPDFTPNEATAAKMGWTLRDPEPDELSGIESSTRGESR